MTANSFRYSRSILISGAPGEILSNISDLRRHELWSPFAKPDGKTVGVYSGAPGVGQSYSFSGGSSGAGRIVIDAVQPERVIMTLAMLKPMKATNTVEFSLTPEVGGTRVAWTMHGPLTLIGRIMGVFIDCDRMCGRMFEQGLAALKALVETRADTRIAA